MVCEKISLCQKNKEMERIIETFVREGTTTTSGLDKQAEHEMKFDEQDSEYMIEAYQILQLNLQQRNK